jgi:uncharacterized repeat protein (TIGR03843 family)
MDSLPAPVITQESILSTLNEGEIDLQGQFVWGSNSTFLVNLVTPDLTLPAIYKPSRGERPLWDFPAASLARREVCAFLVSQALGWQLVPPTVYRRKGPFGKGSLQLFIPHDPNRHYFSLTDVEKESLKGVACFDLLINNADRKGSHILWDEEGNLWAIDHGVCFHREYKLRTVIWDFIGQPIPQEFLEDIRSFLPLLGETGASNGLLGDWLVPGEVNALRRRAEQLLAEGVFPAPRGKDRPFPYPPL